MLTILKPGVIVILESSVKGGVAYFRKELEVEHTNGGGAAVASWETRREIADPAEFTRASNTRSEARRLVEKVCINASRLLLCPTARIPELNEAVENARTLCAVHNAGAQSTRVELFVLQLRIAESEAEAAKAVASEIEGLLARMAQGIKAGDVEEIREAATKVKQVSGVLDESSAARVQVGIEAARKAARELTKAAKDGETAKGLETQLAAVEMSRFAFLDVEPVRAGVVESAEPARALEV